jgi:hypothetical protein
MPPVLNSILELTTTAQTQRHSNKFGIPCNSDTACNTYDYALIGAISVYVLYATYYTAKAFLTRTNAKDRIKDIACGVACPVTCFPNTVATCCAEMEKNQAGKDIASCCSQTAEATGEMISLTGKAVKAGLENGYERMPQNTSYFDPTSRPNVRYDLQSREIFEKSPQFQRN